MKFITTWSARPETRKEAIQNFLAGKADFAAGLTTLGRWHKADGSGGFTLSEAASAEPIYESTSFWSQYLDMQTFPVIEDAAAGATLTKLFKS